MKYKLKTTFILLSMFIVTQFIGLYVVNYYAPVDQALPFGMDTPEIQSESDYYGFFTGIVIAFIFAVIILFFLTKFKIEFILRLWFFLVVAIALAISFNSIIPTFQYVLIMAVIIALPLAFIKIYRKQFLVHNATELFIYPGIAAVFVPILNLWTIIALLILISLYDMWAVWRSGIMIKMAKYQINELKIFQGFFVPYVSKKVKAKLKKMTKAQLKKKKVRVNVAILGGGDVIFPLIAAGVMLKTFGLGGAILTIAGATLSLIGLFFLGQKNKFYPAMPFITSGVFLGMFVSWLVF